MKHSAAKVIKLRLLRFCGTCYWLTWQLFYSWKNKDMYEKILNNFFHPYLHSTENPVAFNKNSNMFLTHGDRLKSNFLCLRTIVWHKLMTRFSTLYGRNRTLALLQDNGLWNNVFFSLWNINLLFQWCLQCCSTKHMLLFDISLLFLNVSCFSTLSIPTVFSKLFHIQFKYICLTSL